MKKIALFVSLLVAFLTLACGKQEQAQAPEEKKATETATVESVSQQAMDKVEQAATQVKETTTEMVEKTTELSSEAAAQAKEKTAAAVTAIKSMAAPESVVIEASYGNVTLPHQMHADTFECTACHGEGTPGALDLGKDQAHSICKGCHQEKGAGPTKCTDCHIKS
jgi:hypothetical protein